METINLPNMAATAALGKRIASGLKVSDVVLLQGDLGAGKTALTREILQALDPSITEVPSPTFTLVQSYDTPKGTVYHYDLYRLKSEDEIDELGWDESLSDGISIVEWPERLGSRAPARAKTVRMTLNEGGSRHAELEGFQ